MSRLTVPLVTIYTERRCLLCALTKRLFRRLDVAFREVELDGHPELRQRISSEHGGWPTVPMVFIGGRFIGGFAQVRSLHHTGELHKLLSPAADGRHADRPRPSTVGSRPPALPTD